MQQEYSFPLKVIIFAISQLSKATGVLFCKQDFRTFFRVQGSRGVSMGIKYKAVEVKAWE